MVWSEGKAFRSRKGERKGKKDKKSPSLQEKLSSLPSLVPTTRPPDPTRPVLASHRRSTPRTDARCPGKDYGSPVRPPSLRARAPPRAQVSRSNSCTFVFSPLLPSSPLLLSSLLLFTLLLSFLLLSPSPLLLSSPPLSSPSLLSPSPLLLSSPPLLLSSLPLPSLQEGVASHYSPQPTVWRKLRRRQRRLLSRCRRRNRRSKTAQLSRFLSGSQVGRG